MKNKDKFMQEHGILYAIFAKGDGITLGDRSSLKYSGVIDQYFGEAEKVANTSFFLKGKELPQSIMQGDQCCLLTILDDSTVAGFFFIDNSNVILRRKRIKAINEDILQLGVDSLIDKNENTDRK